MLNFCWRDTRRRREATLACRTDVYITDSQFVEHALGQASLDSAKIAIVLRRTLAAFCRVRPEILAPDDKALDIEELTEPFNFRTWLTSDALGLHTSQFFITFMVELKREAGRVVRADPRVIEPLSFISHGEGGQVDPDRTLRDWICYAVPIVLADLHRHRESLTLSPSREP